VENHYADQGARMAFRAVMRNLDSLTDDAVAPEAFMFAGQTALWIASLDARLRQSHGGRGYFDKRNADPDGGAVAGALLVRNAIAHGLVPVHDDHGGVTVPMTIPFTITSRMLWATLDDVLARWPDRDEPKSWQKGSYLARFADRKVAEPLHEAARWLERAPLEGWTL
jgi:hypothetical protein